MKTIGVRDQGLAKAPPQPKWLQMLSSGQVVGLFIQAKAKSPGSQPQQKVGPSCACQDGGPGTPREGEVGSGQT